jgi:hypothetical protein
VIENTFEDSYVASSQIGWEASLPPCIRSDSEGTRGSERVRDVILYAAGLIVARHGYGRLAPELVLDRIKELRDHKGTLMVFLWRPIPESMQKCIREAWEVIGLETDESVEFYVNGSEEAIDAECR